MKKLMITVLGCAMASGVFAAGFQLSLVPEVAIQDRNTDINGVSIGLWNENPSSKFQWQLMGLVNGATGDSTGLQFSLLFLPGIYNYAENYTGAQVGFVNYASGNFVGAQLSAVNITGGEMLGLQSGFFNYAQKAYGVQLGTVNYAASVENWCFQLGLVNIIADNAWFKEFPGEFAKGFIIANWSFQ